MVIRTAAVAAILMGCILHRGGATTAPAEKSWVEIKEEAASEASYTGAGTDHAVNYPNVAAHLTRLRIAELKEVLKIRSVGN